MTPRILKSCTVCGRTHPGPGPRCPEHAAQLEREKAERRASNRNRRILSNRDDPNVRRAMAIAVEAAGRCSSCGAMPGPGSDLVLHAHWDKRRYGKAHLPIPGLYQVLCDVCHGQLTATGE
jgi:hypothetical protein